MSNYILAVSGLGNVVGTGAAVARLFARELGYRVALISRPRKEVHDLKDEIAKGGGVAEVFSVEEYSYQSMNKVFEDIKKYWPDGRLKCAVWNTSQWFVLRFSSSSFLLADARSRRSRIPFLDITEKDITASATINIISATAFSQAAVRAFTASGTDADQGGTLIMTGATSATRGHTHFGAFAAGKHGLRALSQSIAREYGPQGVHVAFVVRPAPPPLPSPACTDHLCA